MDYQIVDHPKHSYLECRAGDGRLTSENDALDLVAACGENDTQRLLLHSENLPDEFFDLKTGLAGAALLKFSNYQIKLALVIPAERIGAGRFYEMALEANRSNPEFHVFSDPAAAVDWLVAG